MKKLLSIFAMTLLSVSLCAQTENKKYDVPMGAAFDAFYAKWRGTNRTIDFIGYDVNNKSIKLSDFKGKRVIVDLWYTACHMCIKGFPTMHELASKYSDEDLVVIAFCMPEKKESFEKFVKENKDKYPNFIWLQDRSAEKMNDGVAIKDWGLVGAPSQLMLDKTGKVVWASNFEFQVIEGLPSIGITPDKEDLARADKQVNEILTNRKNNN